MPCSKTVRLSRSRNCVRRGGCRGSNRRPRTRTGAAATGSPRILATTSTRHWGSVAGYASTALGNRMPRQASGSHDGRQRLDSVCRVRLHALSLWSVETCSHQKGNPRYSDRTPVRTRRAIRFVRNVVVSLPSSRRSSAAAIRARSQSANLASAFVARRRDRTGIRPWRGSIVWEAARMAGAVVEAPGTRTATIPMIRRAALKQMLQALQGWGFSTHNLDAVASVERNGIRREAPLPQSKRLLLTGSTLPLHFGNDQIVSRQQPNKAVLVFRNSSSRVVLERPAQECLDRLETRSTQCRQLVLHLGRPDWIDGPANVAVALQVAQLLRENAMEMSPNRRRISLNRWGLSSRSFACS